MATRPARLKVACEPCVLRKARCDPGRPCQQCTFRGCPEQCVNRPVDVPGEPRHPAARKNRLKACEPCNKSKVACADERPCPRCVRLGRPDLCTVRPRRNSRQGQNNPSDEPLASVLLHTARQYSLFDTITPLRLEILLTSLAGLLSRDDLLNLRRTLTPLCTPDKPDDEDRWLRSLDTRPRSMTGRAHLSLALTHDAMEFQAMFTDDVTLECLVTLSPGALDILGVTTADLDDLLANRRPTAPILTASSLASLANAWLDVVVSDRMVGSVSTSVTGRTGRPRPCLIHWERRCLASDGVAALYTGTVTFADKPAGNNHSAKTGMASPPTALAP